MKRLHLLLVLAALVVVSGCGKRETRVEVANREQILLYGNKAEPQDLDPHVVEGVGEHQIISTLMEGLVAEDPKTLEPVPGIAERWELSPEGRVYTFHIRANAKWSNGDSVTADDYVKSYRRILTPSAAGPSAELFRTANRYRDIAIGRDSRTFYFVTDNNGLGRTTDPSGASVRTFATPGSVLEFKYE